MLSRPRISLTAAIGLIDAIKVRNADPDEVLRSVGLDRRAVSDPQRSIASRDFTRLLNAAARATADDCFGLHFGEQFQPKDIGSLTYVVLNSPTFRAGIDNIARYLRVHNGAARVSVALDRQWAHIQHVLTDLPDESARQHYEYSLVVGLGTMRLMAGSQWTPSEVHFPHQSPGDTSEHTRIFGAPVAFGCPTSAVVVESEFLERTVPAADDRLYQILRDYLDRVLEEMPPEDGLPASVRRALGESMRNGDPKLGHVAGKLAMSPRTLQRRLRERGVDFKQLTDDTRRRFALNYLREARHSLSEVAFLLGYSEVSAFNRAFRRWTGETPLAYRRKVER